MLAEYSDAQGRPPAIAGLARIALGMLRYEADDLTEARRELERGFADAKSALGFARLLSGQGAGPQKGPRLIICTLRDRKGQGVHRRGLCLVSTENLHARTRPDPTDL
jgi:hypothetical protein